MQDPQSSLHASGEATQLTALPAHARSIAVEQHCRKTSEKLHPGKFPKSCEQSVTVVGVDVPATIPYGSTGRSKSDLKVLVLCRKSMTEALRQLQWQTKSLSLSLITVGVIDYQYMMVPHSEYGDSILSLK